jgi:GNAT acetyltransferase-like protein
VARNASEIESVRETWTSVNWPRVDADIDFFVAVLETSAQAVRPHVVVLDGEQALGMFVGRVEETHLSCRIGYREVYRPEVRSIVLAHGGLAGTDRPEVSEAILGALLESLRAGEADVLILHALRTDSTFYQTVRRRLSMFARNTMFAAFATHRRLVLPGSFDDFLATKPAKARASLLRPSKKLRRDFGDRLSLPVYRELPDLERIFSDSEVVASKTYQRGLGVAFADTEQERRLVELGLQRGWFRSYFVYIDDKPIAFWPGFLYDRTFFIGTPGYDPEFARYSVGAFQQLQLVEDLCADEDVDAVDFGFGDSEYKRRLGNDSWEESTVLVFAPTFRSFRIQLARAGILGSASLARRILGDRQVAELKRRWRDRLQGGAPGAENG